MKPMAEQVSMFSPDSWSGKTSAGHSVPTEGRTSGLCWKKLAGLQNRPLLFLDMRGGGGQTQELLSEMDIPLLGELTTRNIGEYPNAVRESRLSQILEDSPLPKYSLSPKACQGILNRAAKRGKKLPEILEAALRQQARSRTPDADGGTNPTSEQPSEPRGGGDAVKANLVCIPEISRTLSARYDSSPCVDRGQEFVCLPINTMVALRGGADDGRTCFGIGGDGDPQFSIGANHERAVFCIQGNCIDRADTAGCNGEDVSYTLNTIDRPAVYDGSRRHNYQPFGEVCGTVQAQFGTGGNNTPLVVGSVWDARGNGDGETVPTMTGDHNNRVTDYTAICISGPVTGTLDASYYKGAGARNGQERPVVCCIGNGQADNTDFHDKCPTLSTMHDQQAVMVTAVDCRNGRESEVNGTLQAKDNGGTSLNLNNVCREGTMVRRMTPLECERLQGYPDGWVFIGDWTDENGKKHKQADAPMYKALGNSIALPFWFWLLNRISAFCEEKTMGSLFSGIGGFDLCWQMINGEGSVKFSSEIEPFCVAVMKKRFGDEERSIKGNWMNYVK